ncbi:AMP-binding protein [Ramlibacter alkalitolerans]|uniref:AMP-binding protein n=1 Tax=Ramlibacter alkalitolerans TaxID=2039631 RepID=A0ABS1JHF0_9BURK|nr:AMP-binding protein [Ramlibacter alkalitolerans]MBL0423642.1 AMP-binding protein [Ramlibacter alkalitolerans]
MDDERINAAALLLARGAPQRPALVCGRRSVSYAELRRTVARAATAWRQRGAEAGELVMLRGDHGVDHVVAFLGAMWAGVVPVPLPPALPEDAGSVHGVEFALDASRSHIGQVNGHGGTRWLAWPAELASLPPAPETPCEPWAPACWTEPRTWSGGDALVLPHRFALALSARDGVLALTPARTMLGTLRALRRGTTVILHADAPRLAA